MTATSDLGAPAPATPPYATAPAAGVRSRATPWLLAGWLVALVLLCNPYRGVRHDAMLYLAQALRHLGAPWTSVDLQFLGMSQDRFSVFSTVFSPLVQALGVQDAELLCVLVCNAAFFAAAWRLFRGLPPLERWTAVVALALLPRCYGADHTFQVAEPFLTARSMAEPLALLGLAWVVEGRLVAAAAAGVLALAMHPLMALPVFALAWLWWPDGRRKWQLAAIVSVLSVVLALAGVAPFDGLFRRYDTAWLYIVQQANAFVFLHLWQLPGWQQFAFDAMLLALGARRAPAPYARLFVRAIWLSAGALLLNGLVVDVLHLRLFTQLQIWRASWIGHVLSAPALALLVFDLWRRPGLPRLAAAMVLLAAVFVGAQTESAWIIGACAGVAVLAADRGVHAPARAIVLGLLACAIAALGITVVDWFLSVDEVGLGDLSGIQVGRVSSIPVLLPVITGSLAFVAAWTATRASLAWHAASAAALVGVAGLAATQWDQRSDWSRLIESQAGVEHPFDRFIPPTATVLWTDHALATWSLLGRSAYFAKAQAAGTLFSRELGMEVLHRLKVVAPIDIQTSVCRSLALTGFAGKAAADCEPDELAIADVCHLVPPGPDFVVLESPLKKTPAIAHWTWRPQDSSPTADYYLYDCRSIH